MNNRVKFLIASGVFAILASCGSSIGNIGATPTFTPVGHNQLTRTGIDPILARTMRQRPQQLAPHGTDGSLWNSGPSSLFGDRRARDLGDIMTVVIEIKDEASISNSSNRARSGADSLSVPNFFGIPQIVDDFLPDGASTNAAVGVTSNSSATGNGSVSRNEEITLRVAATVVDVLPNGHLVVHGNQEVRVNFELRDLQVAGIVRPEDISRQNEITYDKIAGARISYGGRGLISDMQQPRIGQQIADTILPY